MNGALHKQVETRGCGAVLTMHGPMLSVPGEIRAADALIDIASSGLHKRGCIDTYQAPASLMLATYSLTLCFHASETDS